jgi:hypothetical protein
MSQIEARLAELGLTLPPAVKPPPGVVLPFRFVRVLGSRALVSGHSPQAAMVPLPDRSGRSVAISPWSRATKQRG